MRTTGILLVLLLSIQALGQDVQATFNNAYTPPYTLEKLLDVSLINNASTEAEVVVQFKLSHADKGLVYKSTSIPVMLAPGMTTSGNLPFSAGNVQSAYVASGYQDFAAGLAPLVSGTYQWCITIGSQQEAINTYSNCIQLTQPVIIPPSLVYPFDHSTVAQKDIVFTWSPAVVPGMASLSYYLKVVETEEEEQLNKPGLLSRSPHYEGYGLNQLSHLHSAGDAMAEDKAYHWSVAAEMPNGELLWADEVWTFNLDIEEPEPVRYYIPERIQEETYIELPHRILGLIYESEYANEELTVKYFCGEKNRELAEHEEILHPEPGLNKYKLKVPPGIERGYYVVKIKSNYDYSQFLKIKL